MIIASDLSKQYGALEAVRGLNFRVESGDVVGLLGPNGAGKTTTMRMLTTFISPTSGTASVCGFDVLTQAHEVRKKIGYLPESPPLYQEFRVMEYLTFVAKMKGVPRKQVSSRVNSLVERCGLGEVRQRLCWQLSKGFRQRVGLAQALIHNPQVIILDEPTSGLDPAQIIEIRNLIAELKGQHTVILSTHILPEVVQTCSRVIIIVNGRVIVQGMLADLTREKTLETQFLEAVSQEQGKSEEREVMKGGCHDQR